MLENSANQFQLPIKLILLHVFVLQLEHCVMCVFFDFIPFNLFAVSDDRKSVEKRKLKRWMKLINICWRWCCCCCCIDAYVDEYMMSHSSWFYWSHSFYAMSIQMVICILWVECYSFSIGISGNFPSSLHLCIERP